MTLLLYGNTYIIIDKNNFYLRRR